MKLAKMAQRTTRERTIRPKTAPRFSRKIDQKAAKSGGWAKTRGSGKAVVEARSAPSLPGMADPRIDHAVKNVDRQADEDDDARDQHDPALQRRIVAAENRLDEPFADAGPGEDRLRQHRAGEQRANRQADHGNDGNHRVAQGVQADDAEGR